MVVNPNLFKNRLINSSIVITILVITVYSLVSFNNLQSQQSQLEKENIVLENELSVMINKFDQEKTSNEILSENFKDVKDSIQATASIVENLKSELAVIPKYKRKVITYSTLNATLNSEKDSLEQINSKLLVEKSKVKKELSNQKAQNKKLLNKTAQLNNTLKERKIVATNSLVAKAMTASFLGKKTNTNRASKAKIIEINFSLEKNLNIDSGKKVFYIQVIGPDNNIVSDKGAVKFGKSSLIYSLKKIINYKKESLDVKALIKNKAAFKKGIYYINVFHEGSKVGNTKILLK